MKNLIKSIAATASAFTLALAMTFTMGGAAQAATCWQYNANGMPTSTTPVFNNICGVPGYGDESDFVRVRPSNGDPTSTSNNASYADTINSTCVDGAKFDVHTYIHNDAEPQYNANGSGSAVAHDVQLAMTAPLGQTSNQFTFGSKITASNAPSAYDTATINCNGEAVQLSLVPNTVKIYGGNAYGWTDLSDGAVNGTTKLGNPNFGSGTVYGCWDYRMSVVYEVVVHKVAKPSVGVCKNVDMDVNKNRSVTVTVNGETSNAKIVGYKIDFGDGTVSNQQTASHTYAKAGHYHVVGYVEVQYANGQTEWKTASACKGEVTVTKPHTPPTIHVPTPPTHLPSTGPAGLAGVFAGTSGLGAISHWFIRRRKFGRQ